MQVLYTVQKMSLISPGKLLFDKYAYTSARSQRIVFIKLWKWSSDSSLPRSVLEDGLERQHMKENATTVNKASVSSWYCGHTASLYDRQTPDLDVFL